MNKPIIQLILIQVREFYREPAILFWAFVFPIAMAWGLGIAFTHKIEQNRNIAYIESSFSKDSHTLQTLKSNSSRKPEKKNQFSVKLGSKEMGYTSFRFVPSTWDEAQKLLKSGTSIMVLEEVNGKPLFHYDPNNSEAQLSYMQLSAFLEKGTIGSSQTEIKPLQQKGSRYIDFLVPGLIAMDLMMSTLWGICYSLIEKRSKKLLRRMVATPMKKSSYLVSQLVARLFLNIIEALILFTFAHYYFGFTLEGSLAVLALVYLAGMFCFTGISILLASRTSNTYIGSGLINAVVMPMMVLSGIFFSYHNFPDAVIPFLQALPLTMLADSIRAVFIEGAGLGQVIMPVAVLSLIGIGTFAVGLKVYKWY